MKNRGIILSVLVCYVMCANAQSSFYEPILNMEEFLIDDWIESNYGVNVRKNEPLKIREKNSVKDSTDGWTHHTYELTYNFLPLEFCQIIIHKKDGVIISINGNCYDSIAISTTPTLSETVARELAISYIDANEYSWQIDNINLWDSIGASQLKYVPQGELVICPDSVTKGNARPRLAYKFEIYATSPESYCDIYIDANNGNVLFSNSRFRSAFATGVADTRYSGIRGIITECKDGTCYLHDKSRCGGQTEIYTYSMTHKDAVLIGAQKEITDSDNYWSASEFHNADKDDAALEAHWAAGITIDYFYDIFGRKSVDGRNKTIKQYIHWKTNHSNAEWNGYYVKYGDGDGFINDAYATLDIVAHELGHAVCDYTADLVYKNESGAINESLSDIWGACVSHYVDSSKHVWWHGYDKSLIGRARDMSNPNGPIASYKCPDTYGGRYWQDYNLDDSDYGGVHYNSGVMNYWFYLLTEGGSGINDNGYSYNVDGVGFDISEQIIYKAQTCYFTSTTNYVDAARYTRDAAVELFGSCSNVVNSVIAAWLAVGISVESNIPDIQYLQQVCASPFPIIYKANEKIVADNVITNSANVTYKAGNEIELLPGFIAEYGTTFQALIEPCYPVIHMYSKKQRKQIAFEDEGNCPMLSISREVLIYPNPCWDIINIAGIEGAQGLYYIYDVNGKLLKVGRLKQDEYMINIEELVPNVYVLMMHTSSETICSTIVKKDK